MTQHLAFLPWIHVPEPRRVRRFELRPYRSDDSTIDAKHHELLRVYEDGSHSSVREATLVAIDGVVGGPLSEHDIADLFRLRDAMSFVGLEQRTFFDLVPPYVNDHSFRLVVQGYEAGKGGAFVEARRRDGRQRIIVDEAVLQERTPYHVSANVEPRLDFELVDTISECLIENASAFEWLLDAIELFCLANTDSSDVQRHAELVLTSSAIQRALGVSKKSKLKQIGQELAAALDHVVPAQRSPTDSKKPLTKTELAAKGGLREVWFADFYKARGMVAHGRTTPVGRVHWSIEEHLLLSSYIFPLLVLARLDALGVRALTDEERERIAGFDWLLCLENVFEEKPGKYPGEKQRLWKVALMTGRRKWRIARSAASLGAHRSSP